MYVRKLALFLKANLREDVKVHVEHSNEVWNQGFAQVRACVADKNVRVRDRRCNAGRQQPLQQRHGLLSSHRRSTTLP